MNSNKVIIFFEKILDAIEYKDDKRSFINKFLKNISLEVLVGLIEGKEGNEYAYSFVVLERKKED